VRVHPRHHVGKRGRLESEAQRPRCQNHIGARGLDVRLEVLDAVGGCDFCERPRLVDRVGDGLDVGAEVTDHQSSSDIERLLHASPRLERTGLTYHTTLNDKSQSTHTLVL